MVGTGLSLVCCLVIRSSTGAFLLLRYFSGIVSHPWVLNDGPKIKIVDLFKMVGTGLSLVCCLVIRGSTGGFLLLRYFSGIVSHPWVLRVSQYVSVESSSLTHHRVGRKTLRN